MSDIGPLFNAKDYGVLGILFLVFLYYLAAIGVQSLWILRHNKKLSLPKWMFGVSVSILILIVLISTLLLIGFFTLMSYLPGIRVSLPMY